MAVIDEMMEDRTYAQAVSPRPPGRRRPGSGRATGPTPRPARFGSRTSGTVDSGVPTACGSQSLRRRRRPHHRGRCRYHLPSVPETLLVDGPGAAPICAQGGPVAEGCESTAAMTCAGEPLTVGVDGEPTPPEGL